MAATSGFSAFMSWMLAPEIPQESGRPPPSVRMWIFDPGLLRSTGLGPVADPLFRTDPRRVDHCPRPVDQPLGAKAVEPPPVQPGPHALGAPARDRAVRGARPHPEHRAGVPP